jgi:hypothetical protein
MWMMNDVKILVRNVHPGIVAEVAINDTVVDLGLLNDEERVALAISLLDGVYDILHFNTPARGNAEVKAWVESISELLT